MCKDMNAIKMNINHKESGLKTGSLLCFLQRFVFVFMPKKMHFMCSGVHFMQKSILFS